MPINFDCCRVCQRTVNSTTVAFGSVGERPKFNFSEYGHVAYLIKGNGACINMVANILPIVSIPGPWGGDKRPKFRTWFSEHGHGAYQINGNDKCSNMPAHIIPLHAPSTPGVGSKNVKTFFFLNVVILHIKLIGIEHRAPCKHVFCPNTASAYRGGLKDLNIFFLKVTCHVSYQLKGNGA